LAVDRYPKSISGERRGFSGERRGFSGGRRGSSAVVRHFS